MKILALDTSRTVAPAHLTLMVRCTGSGVQAPRQHARLLLPMIEALLSDAGVALRELDALAFGCGPGSFTGLRIAAGVVQGLAGVPRSRLVPVSSLRALAQGSWREYGWSAVLSAFDARMGEVYAGIYVLRDDHLMCELMPDQVCAPEALAALPPAPAQTTWYGAGSGWGTYAPALCEQLGVSASHLAPALEPDATM